MDRAEEAEEKVIEKQPAPEELEYRALTMQAIGALLLAFDAIPAVFVGLRDGSLLWLYWTAIEGLIGMALVAAGRRMSERAPDLMAHTSGPHLHAGGEVDHRKAA